MVQDKLDAIEAVSIFPLLDRLARWIVPEILTDVCLPEPDNLTSPCSKLILIVCVHDCGIIDNWFSRDKVVSSVPMP
jgi:hypothetical protein